MSNYYEQLDIDSTTSQDVIEAKLDDEYTKWRALVVHHNPEIVSQAEEALEKIAEIRSVLLNIEKRSKYDREINSFSGLADPNLQIPLNTRSMVPPRQNQIEAGVDHVDVWICFNCKQVNLKRTKHCSSCGKLVGYDCPKCGVLVEFHRKFCTNCGVDKKEYFRQQQKEQVQQMVDKINNQMIEVHLAKGNPKKYLMENPQIKKKTKGCILVAIPCLVFAWHLRLFGSVFLVWVDISGSDPNFNIILALCLLSLLFSAGVSAGAIGFMRFIDRVQSKAKVKKHIDDLEFEIDRCHRRIKEVSNLRYGGLNL